MMNTMAKLCLFLSCFVGCEKLLGVEIFPFFMERQDGSVVEGYFSPPDSSSTPIVFAIQGSSCESSQEWHASLSNQLNSLGLGLIVIEKQGISKDGINLFEYNQVDCRQKRLEDCMLCLANMHAIIPGWDGKLIFWGESEGGMLAANLAAQTPAAAAVLLFGVGGGMKPREEVKWMIYHRLERLGKQQEEIDQYMTILEEQMDLMLLDPTPNSQFLGKTYKWWASFLLEEEAALPLTQLSLPVCLIHGVEDSQIPVLSADLAAQVLAKSNALTYLRLEGYGHDLGGLEIQVAACKWLGSVLFGQGPLNEALVSLNVPLKLCSEGTESDVFNFVFNRGRDNGGGDGQGRGEVHGSVKTDKDSSGNENLKGDVGISYKSENGWQFEGNAGGSVNKDKNGNVSGEVHAEARASKGF